MKRHGQGIDNYESELIKRQGQGIVVKIASYKVKAKTKTSEINTDAKGNTSVFKSKTKNILQGPHH